MFRRSRRHSARRRLLYRNALGRDAGMATAEYAIATLAACGFAALLVTILRSGEVQGLLLGIIRHALALGG
jgi:Protein of unknown function (DUF4244)